MSCEPAHRRRQWRPAPSRPAGRRLACLLAWTWACGGDPGGGNHDAGSDGGAAYWQWLPGNVPARVAAAISPALSELVIDGSYGDVLLNTSTGVMTGFAGQAWNPAGVTRFTVQQGPGLPELLVLGARALRVNPGVTWRVVGGRALVVVAAEDIEVAGTIDLSAALFDPRQGGAAGYFAPWDPPGAGPGASPQPSGGAGHLHPGGASGSNAGGPISGSPQLIPLIGGSSGASATGGAPEGAGGGGGGALELCAGRALTVAAGGGIRASGSGGTAGGGNAAGGGGAGGAILLQAPSIAIAGTLAANGGGGGGDTSPGETGRFDSTPAAGGNGGGQGGAGDEPPGPGEVLKGGGGSAGRIVILSREPPAITGVVSPGQYLVDTF